MQTYGHYIDCAYVEPASGEYIESHTPYTGEVWARIPRASAEDADRAVAAPPGHARGAVGRTHPSARGRLMQRLADLIAANAERLDEVEVRQRQAASRDAGPGAPGCF